MNSGIMPLLQTLKKGYGFGGNKWVADQSFLDLLQHMFHMHPGKRISPEEMLEHDFLASQYGYDLKSNNGQGDSEVSGSEVIRDEMNR